ncbi:MAG: fused MFS/spermidine synthase [Polyangiaceae bacterium]
MMLDPVLAACGAGSAAEFESGVLDGLASRIGFEVGFFAYPGAEPTTVGLDASRLSKAFDPGSPYEAELLPVKQAALAGRGVAIDTKVLGSRRVQQTAYFRDFAKPLGGTHTMFGYLSLRGQPLGALMLGRTGGVFGDADVAALEQLLPRLAVARASFGLPALVSRPLRHTEGWGFPRRHLKVARLGDAEIVVRDRRGFREMVARSRATDAELVWTRSALTDPSRSGWPYVDLFHLAAALAKRRERALFVGCGGAVAPRQFARVYPGIKLDIVEREPCVVSLAQEFFGAAELPNVTFHVEDGAVFVKRAQASTWDVAVVDAYDSRDLAAGLANRTFFGALARVLRPGGTFAFNLISSLDGGGSLSAVLAAARFDFFDLRVLPVLAPDEHVRASDLRNVVVIGTKAH